MANVGGGGDRYRRPSLGGRVFVITQSHSAAARYLDSISSPICIKCCLELIQGHCNYREAATTR
jgi:hypothetical protein